MIQFWVSVVLIVLGCLIANVLWGINQIQWLHVSLQGADSICKPYLAFSLALILLNFAIAAARCVSRIPLGVIAIELVLSLTGALTDSRR
jgi:hypothetical protein